MPQTQTDARTILLVEDSDEDLVLLTSLLTREAYNVLTARTGEEALSVVATRSPDLILMDLGLPGITGLDVIWQIRKRVDLAEVPIIVVSAHDSYDLREEAANAGCKGYVTKPFEIADFKELVRSIFEVGKASHASSGHVR